MHEPATTIRLDLWLWAARFYKTRAVAKQAIETGKVEVGGDRAKPSRSVRIGDGLKIVRGDDTFAVEVTGLSDKRGAASVAQTLYRESEDSVAARLAMAAQRRAERNGYQAPQTKPDKRARRLIRALGDIDAL
ncbi:MAG: S4 domain-containing protein [Pseudomonadota bacterium]|nr:S4 domain-containing protein [Pseudomonadota bacterium]